MAMTACYSNYGLLGAQSISQRQRQQHQQPTNQSHSAQSQLLTIPVPPPSRMQAASVTQKDFSMPLHVDCSVEYELPNQAKPPPGARVEPLLLMIHPCYFRRIESEQRRSPFINNMPSSSRNSSSSTSSQSRRSSRSQQQQQQQQQPSTAYSSHTNQSPQQQLISRSLHQSHHSSAVAAAAAVAVVANQTQIQSDHRKKLDQNCQMNHQRSFAQHTQLSQQAYYPANNNSNHNNINNGTLNRSNSNVNLATNSTANTSTSNPNESLGSLADIRHNWEHSQMAAIPRDFQAGPDATPILSNNTSYCDDKLNALNGKYRQYLRSHRLHPYLMASAATAFPQLTSSVFH